MDRIGEDPWEGLHESMKKQKLEENRGEDEKRISKLAQTLNLLIHTQQEDTCHML
jgi:hypothetical protein